MERGDPFAVIIEQAQEHNADLIVLGEPGKKGLKELFVGTTAERVIRHSDRPVLIVKQRAVDAYRRVLVAADFPEGCSRALGAGYEIAPSAEVLAVHAWQLPPVGLGTRQAAEKAMNEDNELLSRRIERQARDHLVAQASPPKSPRIEMREGNPFLVIRGVIASFQADLLAMGTHARSRIAALHASSWSRLPAMCSSHGLEHFACVRVNVARASVPSCALRCGASRRRRPPHTVPLSFECGDELVEPRKAAQ